MRYLKTITPRPFFMPREEDNQPADNQPADNQPADNQPADNQPAGNSPAGNIEAQMAKKLADTQKQLTDSLTQIKNLQTTASLTGEEREALQKKVEEYENSMLTTKQLADKKEKELRTQHETLLKAEKAERKKYQELYIGSTIQRSLTDAAVSKEAYNPSQIVSILGPQTELVESADGSFEVKVAIQSMIEGKMETLKVDPLKAVEELTTQDSFANLFKSNVKAGPSRHNGAGQGKPDAQSAAISLEEYKRYRNA